MTSTVHAIYCDDVRREVGNKLSFMGIYSHSLNVPQFPYVMPRFAVAISVHTPIGEPYKSVRLELRADDAHTIHGEDVGESDLNTGIEIPPNDEFGIPYTTWYYTTTFMFTPFTFSKPCVLRVVAIVDGIEWKSAALRVREMKSSPEPA